MKLLADENFPPSLISELQRKHHNVKRIQRALKGISDISVLKRAQIENRVLITFDKGIVANKQEKLGVSVMVLDFPSLKPEQIAPYLDDILQVIIRLKRSKKTFKAIYSKKGLESK